MKLVFCGSVFPAARELLAPRLPADELIVAEDRQALERLRDTDVLIPMMFRIDAPLLQIVRPRLIQQWGSGLEGVDLTAARALEIPVCSVPASGSNAKSVGEHLILLILALLRQFPQAQANVRAGLLGEPIGRALAARTVCIWGLGATGLELARRLHAMEARVIGITREPDAPKVASFGLDRCYSSNDCAAALKQADVLALCVRLSERTRGLINADVIKLLPSGAYIVNAARGALLDYRALYGALVEGRLAGVGLDVFWDEPIRVEDPLLSLPGVIATPHVAGVTDRSYGEIADALARNVEHLRQNEPLQNQVP